MRIDLKPDERGVAMVLELILVAFVLGLAGLAIYQSEHRPKAPNSVAATNPTPPPAPNTTAGVAATIAQQADADAASQATDSAASQTAADQLNQSDNDVTSLGGTSNVSY
jgi:hypothetical protein